MTLKRRRVFLLTLLLFPLSTGVYWSLRPDEPGTCTRDNFDRITMGMDREQIIQMVGPPTGEGPMWQGNLPVRTIAWWDTATARGDVWLTTDGTINHKTYFERPWRERIRVWWLQKIGTKPPF
jgi:hypothetical protein